MSIKLRLNTKYFRPRLALWVGFTAAGIFAFFTYTFIKTELPKSDATSNKTDIIFITVLLAVMTVMFVFIGLAALNTYREQFLAFDKARLKRRGIWHKLTVLGDWLTK